MWFCDFNRGMTVSARWPGLSILESLGLLGISPHINLQSLHKIVLKKPKRID